MITNHQALARLWSSQRAVLASWRSTATLVLDVAQALLGERGGGGDLDQLAGTGAAVAATSTRPGAVVVDGSPIAAAVALASSSAPRIASLTVSGARGRIG